MKKTQRLLLTVSMVFILLCMSFMSAYAMEETNAGENEVSPCLTNSADAAFSFSVIDPGEATFFVSYTGISGTFTQAKLTVQVQKKFLGLFWKDVGDEWVGYSTDLYGDFYDSIEVSGSGTYRAQFTLEIEGNTGVTDVIEDTIQCKYSG